MMIEFPELETINFSKPDQDGNIYLVDIRFSQDEDHPKFKFGEIFLEKNQLFINAGDKSALDEEKLRKLGGFLAKYVKTHEINAISLTNLFLEKFTQNEILLLCEGLFLGLYSFEKRKQDNKNFKLSINVDTQNELLINELQIKQQICSIINFSRELGQLPGNVINPVSLAEICQEVCSKTSINVKTLDENALESIGAQAILSVGKGSKSKPRMIILEYTPPSSTSEKPVVLVGKAITFDTGGYSIKPVDGIKSMKFDKLGGVTVLGTMLAAAYLKLEKKIIGIICAAENMISEDAYRPDDIIDTLSGKTVEILSTDAEGRLVLADGISYAQKYYDPACIIDFATLTGGIVIALGKIRAGLFSNNETLSDQLFQSGEKTNEKLWKMPLDDDYFEFIKGEDSDLKNAGGREGHPIMGAIFLKQFIENDIPWAHIDIAGAATSAKSEHYLPKGAKGFGIRLMLDFLNNY